MKLLKKVLKIVALSSLVVSFASAAENLAVVYTFDKPNEAAFEKMVNTDLKSIGFFANDPHPRVHDVYVTEFGKTKMDYLGFTSMMNEKVVRELMNIDPRIGGFGLFNLLNYRKQSDMKTVVSHLTPEAMLDIIGIDNKEVREKFIASFKPLDDMIEKKLGGTKSYLKNQGIGKNTMMNYEIAFDEPEDFDDFMDEFEESFRSMFGEKGFIVAGFYNVKESFNSKEDVMPGFRTYWTFDLCHIPFSYTIFDGGEGKSLAEAGIYAPCSIYVYVKEGENKIVIGMPAVKDVWASSLGMKDDDKLRYVDRMEEEIPAVFKALGGKPVANVNPFK